MTYLTKNFTVEEMACRHCGAFYQWPEFMDRLQMARDIVARPFRILSAHRCAIHNAKVRGAPLSEHLRLAVDIDLRGHDRNVLHEALKQAGFRGFGFYQGFIHADLGRARFWYSGDKARAKWQTS